MEYVTLPDSELQLSRIAFGCEPLGGTDWGHVDVEAVQDSVRYAWEKGITTFDTADIYGLGLSESRLADALGSRRHEATIITKFGVRADISTEGRARTWKDVSPVYLKVALRNSLRRLQLDSIPVYLVHWPDSRTAIEDTIAALVEAKDAGLIRHFGLSNYSPNEIVDASLYAPISAVEVQYSMISRQAEQREFAAAKEAGATILAYGVLAQGLLTGKYGDGVLFRRDDRRHRLPHFNEGRAKHQGVLHRLSRLSQALGRKPSEVAVRWALDSPGVDVAVVGMKNRSQVDAGMNATNWRLDTSEWRFLVGASNEAAHQ